MSWRLFRSSYEVRYYETQCALACDLVDYGEAARPAVATHYLPPTTRPPPTPQDHKGIRAHHNNPPIATDATLPPRHSTPKPLPTPRDHR